MKFLSVTLPHMNIYPKHTLPFLLFVAFHQNYYHTPLADIPPDLAYISFST